MPCTTLMKSNTTRRSAPRMRSRLRRPTSKSTTQTFCPVWASAAPSDAVDVVLPTPPFPDVTTMTLHIRFLPFERLAQQPEPDRLAFEPRLKATAFHIRTHIFGGRVDAADTKKFGARLAAEDPGGR